MHIKLKKTKTFFMWFHLGLNSQPSGLHRLAPKSSWHYSLCYIPILKKDDLIFNMILISSFIFPSQTSLQQELSGIWDIVGDKTSCEAASYTSLSSLIIRVRWWVHWPPHFLKVLLGLSQMRNSFWISANSHTFLSQA